MNSEGLSDRFLDYAASIIIAKIRDRIICDKSGVLNISKYEKPHRQVGLFFITKSGVTGLPFFYNFRGFSFELSQVV